MRMIAFTAIAASALAFATPAAFAACQLPNGSTPGLCTYSGPGPALQITDPASSTATATPSTFKGIATGTSGHGVTGEATGKNGVGGFFQAVAPATSSTTTTALEAVNSGGKTSAEGNYGSAGVFTITNAKNESPGVAITTNGINSYGLSVVNAGGIDGTLNTGLPFNQGGMAGYFALTNPNSSLQAAVYGVSTGDTGSAATFITSDATNTGQTVYVQMSAPTGTALLAVLQGTGCCGIAVSGEDQTSGGGAAVSGESSNGESAAFFSGAGGSNACVFNGGATWVCTDPAAMMKDRAKPKLGELLDKLDAMPVNYYRLEGAKVPERYLGPSAEDFHAAFGLGRDDQSIRDGNAYGVALAAAQGLYRKLKADEAEIVELKQQLAEQKTAMAAMQTTLARLATDSRAVEEARLADR